VGHCGSNAGRKPVEEGGGSVKSSYCLGCATVAAAAAAAAGSAGEAAAAAAAAAAGSAALGVAAVGNVVDADTAAAADDDGLAAAEASSPLRCSLQGGRGSGRCKGFTFAGITATLFIRGAKDQVVCTWLSVPRTK